MEKVKLTVRDLARMKVEGRKIRMVTVYDYPVAVLMDRTDIEIAFVGDSLGMVVLGYEATVPVTMEDMIHHARAVARGTRRTFLLVDMPFGSYHVSPEQAVANAVRLMKDCGADAVKLEGGAAFAPVIRAIVRAGIPVMAHIGLTPQTASALGGLKVQGKDLDEAAGIYRDAVAVEEAGAFGVVIEAVPAPLAKIITERLKIFTIGIGAGAGCDGQVLVLHDLLGLFDRYLPKFAKRYRRLDQEILEALNEYAAQVADGSFPGPEHSFAGKEEAIRRHLDAALEHKTGCSACRPE
jgi:3-methyl-2-oxobutanoate hydroxymethyltransferase